MLFKEQTLRSLNPDILLKVCCIKRPRHHDAFLPVESLFISAEARRSDLHRFHFPHWLEVKGRDLWYFYSRPLTVIVGPYFRLLINPVDPTHLQEHKSTAPLPVSAVTLSVFQVHCFWIQHFHQTLIVSKLKNVFSFIREAKLRVIVFIIHYIVFLFN